MKKRLWFLCLAFAFCGVSWGDEDEEGDLPTTPSEYKKMANEGRYDEVEEAARKLLKKDALCHSSDILTSVYAYLGKVPFPKLEEWSESSESHIPWIARGKSLIVHAWQARGGGWAYTVTEEGGKLFKERLGLAKEDLEKAYELNPEDPNSSALMLTVAKGLGFEQDEREMWFQRAIKADPCHYGAYSAKLEYLKPKWGGSEEEMFEFAREASRKAPAVSTARLLVVNAHVEMHRAAKRNGDEDYLKDPEVWKEIEAAYTQYLSHHPDAMRTHNFYAKYATWAGRYRIAKKEFGIIGDHWLPSAWGSYWKFHEAKSLAFSKAKKGPEASQLEGQDPLALLDKKVRSILEGVQKRYASLSTYQDVGQLDTWTKRRGREDRRQLNFTNQFKRPKKFRFEWEWLWDFSKRLIISDGKETFDYRESLGQYQKEESLRISLAGATGVSKGSVGTIAEWFLPEDWWGGNVWRLKDLRHIGQENVEGVLCEVIQDKHSKKDVIYAYWIGTEDFLIRKVKEESRVSKEEVRRLQMLAERRLKKKRGYKLPSREPEEWSTVKIEVHREIKVDEPIAEDVFRFKPPKGAKKVERWKVR